MENAKARWNVKTGATRSGKTFLDLLVIPKRIRARLGKPGLVVILGVSKSTIERNILEPMREIWGDEFVGKIGVDNRCEMFGEKAYCLGAEKVNQVSKLRGAAIKYAYGDEVTDWNQEVFDMLKSRLDKPYSIFDGTCNPDNPRHWFKQFLDSDADIFQQAYCIDDNPFLDPAFVDNLKREYAGTVLYDRYIRGLWVAAEGAIYRPFVDASDRFIVDDLPFGETVRSVNIGVDFGGGTSAHAFCCVGFTTRGRLIVLDEYREQRALDPVTLAAAFVDFVRRCKARWIVADIWCDSAEQTLINGLRQAASNAGLGVNIGDARKRQINDRIRATLLLMGSGRFLISRGCAETIAALKDALWDGKKETEDVRLDDGTTNIDSLDALEYAFEREIPILIEGWR